MSIRRFFMSTLCIILACPVLGQYNKDSVTALLHQIRNMPPDTAQAAKLRILGHDLIEQDSALSKQLLQEALHKSLLLKDPNTITNCYRLMGIWHSYFEEYAEAMSYYRLSFKSAQSNDNKFLAAGVLYNMGNIKYWQSAYDSCIHFYTSSLKLFEDPEMLRDKTVTERKLDMRKSDIYSNLSQIFNTLKNIKKADEYIDKAIAIAKKYDSPAAADALAYYMQTKADIFFENGQTEKALHTRLAFLSQMEQGKTAKTYVQTAYQNIAQEYFALGKVDSSQLYAQKSLTLSSTLKLKSGIANANLQLGRIALHRGDNKAAAQHLNTAKDFYINSKDHLEQRNYFDVMRELAFAQGKYRDAYLYFEKFSAVNDSLLISEKSKEFSEREMRYETEKKEAQIKLQQASISQKNTLNYILVGGALALIAILILGYRNYSHRQKLQQQRISELETEKQLTATEAVLKGEEQERTRLAKDLHDGLGGMLSGIKHSFQNMKGNLIMTPDNAQAFERSMDMLDSSIREMRRVAHNMMPEALVKFGLDAALKDFCNDINLSGTLAVNYQSIGLNNEKINDTVAITTFRIVQELLNNVLKHAAAATAIVQATRNNNALSVTVEDDGKGFDTSSLNTSRGIGWSNIKNRVEFLKGKIDIHSEENTGTSVFIELPV